MQTHSLLAVSFAYENNYHEGSTKIITKKLAGCYSVNKFPDGFLPTTKEVVQRINHDNSLTSTTSETTELSDHWTTNNICTLSLKTAMKIN